MTQSKDDHTDPTTTDIERNDGDEATPAHPAAESHSTVNSFKLVSLVLLVTTIGFLVSTIVLAIQGGDDDSNETNVLVTYTIPTVRPPSGDNYCAGSKPDLPNVQCIVDAVEMTGEQAGANVTKGYNGLKNTSAVPITVPYFQAGLCPVNVHWHLGTEHYSAGEFDEEGKGPSDVNEHRRLAGKTRLGYQCRHYDADDEKFTKAYDWKHCENMEVGQTYEVHWPHSAAGACGTTNQFQTPFYDGVFCHGDILTNTAQQIGVQAQVFTIVNDEDYYWPDLMRGMIVDGEFGSDLAKYTGSTTGTSVNNEICSQFAPITWQVDRKCHMVSASTFDKMCADMKAQRDDMSDDLYPHGSRVLVADYLAANNHYDANIINEP